MRPRILSLALGIGAAVAIVAGPVAASASAPVVITLDVNLDTGMETFTATGAFCSSGSAVSSDATRTGGRSPVSVFNLTKTFSCTDSSDTLTIGLSAVFTPQRGGTIGGWKVTGGTGAYAGAMGGGHIVGVGTDTGILDTYTGTLVY